MKERKKVEKELLKRNAPTLDSGLQPAKPESYDEGITQESFDDALKRASRKISQPESETKES